MTRVTRVNPVGIAIRLSTEADRTWGRWYDENNALARQIGGFLGGFYIKLEAHVARFALILHILKHAHDDVRVMIDNETMQDAIELGEYFRNQLRRFLPLLLSEERPVAQGGAGLLARVTRFMRHDEGEIVAMSNVEIVTDGVSRDELPAELKCISMRDLLRGLRVKKEEVLRELDTQIDLRLIHIKVGTGARPREYICLHPQIVTESETRDNFDSDKFDTIVPTPPSVVNGKWSDPPW
jgi:hypothetical protein